MEQKATYKAMNKRLTIVFIAWCIALYIVLQTGLKDFWTRVQEIFSSLYITDGLFLVMAPILALVGTHFLSVRTKESLVFWRIYQVLPGHRAFSHWARNDPRIDVDKLERKLGQLPTDPREQNTSWFALFRQHEAGPGILDVNRNFLLTTNFAVIALLFGVFGGIASLIVQGDVRWALLYFGVMVAHYLVFAIVARNFGNNLVCNVLAVHSIAS